MNPSRYKDDKVISLSELPDMNVHMVKEKEDIVSILTLDNLTPRR